MRQRAMENAAFAHVCRAWTSVINSGPVARSLDCNQHRAPSVRLNGRCKETGVDLFCRTSQMLPSL